VRHGTHAAPYNDSLLTQLQRERIDVVLVSPRNPLNIGAVARAMANFGFTRLTVVAPFEAHWREAKSAVGAPDLLNNARETATLAEAVAACTLVVGTGTLQHRKPEQKVVGLTDLPLRLTAELGGAGRIALVFGPEKHGLTRDDLSYCHSLVEIPTDARQPSMNLGQAVAVCLYELTRPAPTDDDAGGRDTADRSEDASADAASGTLDRLVEAIEETMRAADYSPQIMEAANRHDLRLLVRRLHWSEADVRRALGIFRRILWRLRRRTTPQ
jgi:tRNA/rRNA methyltransferase